jgi:acyl CoA:acetate/3-ketoacid CoA transferase beta subunit
MTHTLEELLIARMAREFRGNAMGVGATILSDLAARLAKALYVPDLLLCTASRAAADCDVHAKSVLDEWTLTRTARIALPWDELFQIIAQGRFQIFIGAVQVDRFGASNISVIGSWDRPKVQLVGARGVPDDLWGCERLCYHIRQHTKRSIVEKVDFVCSFGYGPGRDPRAAKPGLVVTDLGVFDFDADSGMRIVSLHPDVGFATLQERTGFTWPEPSGPIPLTPAPTAEELRVIRELIDPHGVRRLEANDGDVSALDLWRTAAANLREMS